MAIVATLFLCAGVSASPLVEFAEMRLTNAAPEKVLSRFLDYPPGRGVLGFPRCLFENPFKPNPDFYLKGMDFSCVSPWNDSYGQFRAGTAISKRHIIFAKHFPLASGTRIAFVGVNGDTSHYTVKATRTIPNSDAAIGLLDYELTPDVRPAKILPDGFLKWIVEGQKWPVVTFNQKEQAFVSEATSSSNPKDLFDLLVNPFSIKSAAPFAAKLISGDSGDPAFLIYRNQPILLYCLSGGGCGCGPLIHRHRQNIQKAMDELCPGYRLETFNFSYNHTM